MISMAVSYPAQARIALSLGEQLIRDRDAGKDLRQALLPARTNFCTGLPKIYFRMSFLMPLVLRTEFIPRPPFQFSRLSCPT